MLSTPFDIPPVDLGYENFANTNGAGNLPSPAKSQAAMATALNNINVPEPQLEKVGFLD